MKKPLHKYFLIPFPCNIYSFCKYYKIFFDSKLSKQITNLNIKAILKNGNMKGFS